MSCCPGRKVPLALSLFLQCNKTKKLQGGKKFLVNLLCNKGLKTA